MDDKKIFGDWLDTFTIEEKEVIEYAMGLINEDRSSDKSIEDKVLGKINDIIGD